jgi:acetyl esterase/lipase
MALGVAPSILAQAVAAGPKAAPVQPERDPYSYVNLELLPAIKAFTTLSFDPQVLAVARKGPSLPPLPLPAPQPVERMIPGPAGAPDVHITIVDPSPDTKNKPVFFHTHGGGYIAKNGALLPFIQHIATECKCLVVSVDYRLAPETKFPGSLLDNYAALQWVYGHADELGIDRKRIAVGGESAGGGQAAALAIYARDKGEIPLLYQLLIYPMLDDRTGSTRSVPPYIGHFVWNATSNRFGWTSLLGVPAGSAKVPAGAVPARVANLEGLPPAFIGVGSIDLFVDEDIEYARRLIDSGIATDLLVIPGAYHGFDLLAPDAGPSRHFTESWMSALRRAFATA